MLRGIHLIIILAVIAGLHFNLFAKAASYGDVLTTAAQEGMKERDYKAEIECIRNASGNTQAMSGCVVAANIARDAHESGQAQLARILGMNAGSANGYGPGGNSNSSGGGDRGSLLDCRESTNGIYMAGTLLQGFANLGNVFVKGISAYYAYQNTNKYLDGYFNERLQVSNDMRQCAVRGTCNYIPLGTDAQTAPWYVIPPNQASTALGLQNGLGYMMGMGGYGMLGGYGMGGFGMGGYGMGGMGYNNSYPTATDMARASADAANRYGSAGSYNTGASFNPGTTAPVTGGSSPRMN